MERNVYSDVTPPLKTNTYNYITAVGYLDSFWIIRSQRSRRRDKGRREENMCVCEEGRLFKHETRLLSSGRVTYATAPVESELFIATHVFTVPLQALVLFLLVPIILEHNTG